MSSVSSRPTRPARPQTEPAIPLVIGLNAAIVTTDNDQPMILTLTSDRDGWPALPFGPFDPLRHRTLEIGLRAWVEDQSALDLGYVEQLYTFGDRGRHAGASKDAPHVISVGYLALTRNAALAQPNMSAGWQGWYQFFPWEDWRNGKPELIDQTILPALAAWAGKEGKNKIDRIDLCFGLKGLPWNEEKVLERYELMYAANLVPESARDNNQPLPETMLGSPMQQDHRRILATAMSRLRGKLKYRPVIFELMPETFTLYELQRAIEAISGMTLHKQNFRRFVEKTGLVETTGRTSKRTGGRPAAEFRFRGDVLHERPTPGVKLAAARRKP